MFKQMSSPSVTFLIVQTLIYNKDCMWFKTTFETETSALMMDCRVRFTQPFFPTKPSSRIIIVLHIHK